MNFSSGQNKVAANTRWPYSVNGVVLRWGSTVKNNANQQQQALTLKVQLWLCGVVIAVKQPRKRKNTPKLVLPLEPVQKNKMKDNKPYILVVLRHILAIFSSQISTMTGNIRRHLEARNNQSAMTNLST